MNNVVLIGRPTTDPELRYIAQSQTAVATFTLAVDRPYSKEKQADFIRIQVFGRSAENCERFLKKGKLVAIQGHIQTSNYKKDGATVYTTEVIADRVEFIEWASKKKGTDSEGKPLPEGIEEATEEDDDVPF